MNLSTLAGLGEDESDVVSDRNPYLRLENAAVAPPSANAAGWLRLARRRTRSANLTGGGLAQPPELMGVDADPRVPNSLQPISGEMAHGGEVANGVPRFHNPDQSPSRGVASSDPLNGDDAGQAEPAGLPTGLPLSTPVPDVSNESADLSGLGSLLEAAPDPGRGQLKPVSHPDAAPRQPAARASESAFPPGSLFAPPDAPAAAEAGRAVPPPTQRGPRRRAHR